MALLAVFGGVTAAERRAAVRRAAEAAVPRPIGVTIEHALRPFDTGKRQTSFDVSDVLSVLTWFR